MVRFFSLALLIVLLMISDVLAGFSSYNSPYSSDSVIAPIQIKDKGMYNLVISIQFMNEPYDKKVYKSDAYQNFVRRLKVQWSGVALLQVLKSKEQSINDLAHLKGNIEAEIAELVDQLKNKYSIEKNVEAVYSLSNFFLLEPKHK